MANRPISYLTALFIVFSVSCGTDSNPNLINIDHIKAEEMISSSEPPLIIDVRTSEEFNGNLYHLDGAILIPHYQIRDSLSFIRNLNGKDVLIVCRSGRRSKIAGNELVDLGVKNVYNLKDGLIGWYANIEN